MLYSLISDSESNKEIKTQIEVLKEKLKDEINWKIELVKEGIYKIRKELHDEVDHTCENALECFIILNKANI